MAVAHRIGQRFLDHAVERNRRVGRELRRHCHVDHDAQPEILTHAVGERLHGRQQAEMVEDRRPQLVDDPPQLQIDERDHVLDRQQACVGRRQLLTQPVDGQIDRRQQLPDLVVERVSDPPRLLFERVLQRRRGRGATKDHAIARPHARRLGARRHRPRREENGAGGDWIGRRREGPVDVH